MSDRPTTQDLEANGRYTQPFVSVIIPAFNTADTIERCVAAALDQDWPDDRLEVIVVDNGSRDDTAARAQRLGARVISEPVRGRSRARNLGARESRGSILAFTDADCEVPREWVGELTRTLSKPWIGAAQARVRKHGQAPPGRDFVQAHYFNPFLDTCAMVTTRRAFDAARGFDEELRRAVDMDFSFRLLECGFAFVWLPDVVVIKHHDLTQRQLVRRGWDGGRSTALLDRKWNTRLNVSRTHLWMRRLHAWSRAILADARHPRHFGSSSTESTAKLAACLLTELRSASFTRVLPPPVTQLPEHLGAHRSLVLVDDGALVFDRKQRKVERLSATETAALTDLLDAASAASSAPASAATDSEVAPTTRLAH